ncbi:MAG: DMT family transporter [candidate division Zixibacteria bacterium]|nr:DMT family transporter [candidate division Zixibacteria bacterium]
MTNAILLTVAVLWGASFVGTKMALAYLTPTEIIAIRLLLGVLSLRIILAFKKSRWSPGRGDIAILLFSSAVLGFHFWIQAVGLNYTTATNTGWLIATVPVFIAAASAVFLREKITPRRTVGIILAAVGVILLVSKGRLHRLDWLQSFGDWLILASCVTWTVYTIVTRNISRRVNTLVLTYYLMLLPMVFLVAYCLGTSSVDTFITLPLPIILVLLFLGVLCLGVAHWLWVEGLARKGATDAGVFIYLEPLVTTAVAVPVLQEQVGLFTVVGAAMIIGGVYIVERRYGPK